MPVLHPEPVLRILIQGTPEFGRALSLLSERGEQDLSRVEPVVREILAAVRAEGDSAVVRYNQRFGGRSGEPLVRREYPGKDALERLPEGARAALELAVQRVKSFHARQLDAGFRYDEAGVTLAARVIPLQRCGVYAPGGKARYPSSVVMCAAPAAVAGVEEIVLATPLSGDEADDVMFAAAYLSGVSAIVDAGGAQAIAALAYGTASIPRVDKIVGPGNAYVACAKRLVFGTVDIDGIAGPSEILVLADDEADPRFVAADLLSQAEHDEAAYPFLVCVSDLMANAVARELASQLETLPRAAIARASLERNGFAFVVPTASRMAELANLLAPEHASLQVTDPEAMLARIRRAGAVFLGPLTPEAAGDYVAGPSHVLPTGGAARFGSPLGVYDFVTRTSVVRYSPHALAEQAPAICTLARLEGLEAHARAVEVRLPRS